MRLFLSSYRAGQYPDKLVDLFGKGCKIAVITNAKDYKSISERDVKIKEVIKFLADIGLNPEELDLRKYFDNPRSLVETIKKYQGIWLAGGNTFILRRALRYSQLDNLLKKMVRNNEIILGGESAGACIASPTLRGLEFGDGPKVLPESYRSHVIWSGLGLVKYSIVPHYDSEEFGPKTRAMARYFSENGIDYKTLSDSQAIIINGDKTEFLK